MNNKVPQNNLGLTGDFPLDIIPAGSKMTVCIAAMADNGNSFVLAADTMVTHPSPSGGYFVEQIDPSCNKIFNIGSSIYLLSAGSPQNISPVIREVIKKMKPNAPIIECSNIIKAEVNSLYNNKIQDEILSRYNFDWGFFKEKQQSIHQLLMEDIKIRINSYNPDIFITLAGYDPQGGKPYLGAIYGQGIELDKTLEAFLCTGIGSEVARFSMINSGYNKTLPQANVKKIIEDAMKNAERVSGVGPIGDIVTIQNPSQTKQ